MRTLLAVFMAALVAGCPQAKYQDASDAEQYSDLAGSRYQTNAELVLHGVSYDRGPKKTIDEYVITEKPGFGGPEVITRATLKKGTTLQIKRVLVCTNCLTSMVKFDVEVDPPLTSTSVPVSLEGGVSDNLTRAQDGRVTLPPDLFLSK